MNRRVKERDGVPSACPAGVSGCPVVPREGKGARLLFRRRSWSLFRPRVRDGCPVRMSGRPVQEEQREFFERVS